MPLLFGYIVNVTKNSGRKLKKIYSYTCLNNGKMLRYSY